MGSLTDFLFQGNPIPPQTTGSDSSTSYPAWLQSMVYGLGNAAFNLAGTPYTPYPGQQVATPSAATQRSWDMAGAGTGAFQPDLTSAESMTRAAGTPITGADITKYMNPYMDEVIGGLTSASNRNLFDTVLPGIQDRFVSAGQSRSPQEAELTARAVGQSQKGLDESIAGALGAGYQGALNTAISQQGAQLAGGAAMGQLGALGQQLRGGDIGTLAAAGQAQDQNAQQNLNASMSNFYSQQQWPYQNLGFASNIIRGLPVNTNTQTVGMSYAPGTGGYQASPLATFLGAVSGGKALGFARGGHARRRRPPARGALSIAMGM